MADANDMMRAQQQVQSLIASSMQTATSGKAMWGIFADTRGLLDRKPGFNIDNPIVRAGRGKKKGGIFSEMAGEGIMAGLKKCAEAGAVVACRPEDVFGNAQSGLEAPRIEAPHIGSPIPAASSSKSSGMEVG